MTCLLEYLYSPLCDEHAGTKGQRNDEYYKNGSSSSSLVRLMFHITLFEHEAKAFPWTERDVIALERLHRALGREVVRATTRGGVSVLQANQHIGVFHFGSTTLQVLPKMYQGYAGDTEERHVREATRNVLFLLTYALDLPFWETGITSLLYQHLDWFEILSRLFATHLTEEWQRGAYRSYQETENEQHTLKGKWRVTEQLRHPERKHLFIVTFDDFSADNPLIVSCALSSSVSGRLLEMPRHIDCSNISGKGWMR